MSLLKPCVECGELTEEARCSEHAPQPGLSEKRWVGLARHAGWKPGEEGRFS